LQRCGILLLLPSARKGRVGQITVAENKHQLVQPALLVGEVSSIARDEGK